MGRSLRPDQKIVRDVSRLSGKPLAETLEPSCLGITTTTTTTTSSDTSSTPTTSGERARNGDLAGERQETWTTSSDLTEQGLPYTPDTVHRMMEFSLINPNKSSPNLFRADILYDSLGELKTPRDREESLSGVDRSAATEEHGNGRGSDGDGEVTMPLPAMDVTGFTLQRTVVRRLIPRNIIRDRRLDQTCHFYEGDDVSAEGECRRLRSRSLVIFTPHVRAKEELPWYHPLIQSLAFLYEYEQKVKSHNRDEDEPLGHGTMSVHFLPFPTEPLSTRLERMLLSFLNTHVRLARGSRSTPPPTDSGSYNPDRDNIIPQHLIQNTYTRLKLRYAADLCKNWVEETEPSKHAFEDLSIAAFLIELWRKMYGVRPTAETLNEATSGEIKKFPGFVDVACGNGVLAFVLSMEGYKGWAFDARRRKTWKIFPAWIQDRLQEAVYIPTPFLDALETSGNETVLQGMGVESHRGVFPDNTFIISNHADELTTWTPLMAILSNPKSPLPFLAIPCCSHSLSGAGCRYPPPKTKQKLTGTFTLEDISNSSSTLFSEKVSDTTNMNPASGDLKALRAEKQQSHTAEGFAKSRYGSLMFKTMELAQEVGYEVEKTLLRIPSTRNMAIIGGRRRASHAWNTVSGDDAVNGCNGSEEMIESVTAKVVEVVRRECSKDGGVAAAAKTWVERAKSVHVGPGMGKQRERTH